MKEILKIVIADDNENIVNAMKEKIEKNERYKVIGIANDENEEINLINKLRPNLVITDLKKKNNWCGLDIIKENENKEYKPIFCIVSASVHDYIKEIRNLEIKYYLNKPYDTEDLFRVLNHIYDDIYPKAIIEVKKEILKKDYDNFWNKIIKRLIRIG